MVIDTKRMLSLYIMMFCLSLFGYINAELSMDTVDSALIPMLRGFFTFAWVLSIVMISLWVEGRSRTVYTETWIEEKVRTRSRYW